MNKTRESTNLHDENFPSSFNNLLFGCSQTTVPLNTRNLRQRSLEKDCTCSKKSDAYCGQEWLQLPTE